MAALMCITMQAFLGTETLLGKIADILSNPKEPYNKDTIGHTPVTGRR